MQDKKTHRAVVEVDEQLLEDISDLIENKSDILLKNILADIYPADIANIINNLDDVHALSLFKLLNENTGSEVLLELNEHHRDFILEKMSAGEISHLVTQMESDDAADIVSGLEEDVAENVLTLLDKEDSEEVKELLEYAEHTAGGIMQKEFIVVKHRDTIEEAVRQIRIEAGEMENIYYVWVIDDEDKLLGVVPFITLIIAMDSPATIIADIMNPEVISVDVDADQEEVAKIFQKYNLVSLPVVDKNKKLAGRISIDDIVDIIEEEFTEDVAKIVGSGAGEIESKSPVQIAWLRLPWVIITLAIQFIAGLVIHHYDETLSKVILLTSFMPIISAISGNTGLQASAMTVRSLATGHVSISRWREPIIRSMQISLIIGACCGIILGFIGGYWYGKISFGLIVGLSMCISINISAFVGTSTPLISKKLGFDPAITVGPFETAFQDVVGITVFLTLATLSLKWLI